MTVRGKQQGGGEMSEVLNRLDTVDAKLEVIAKGMADLATWRGVMDMQMKGLVDPPTMEARVKEYADQRDTHKMRGLQDFIINKAELDKQTARVTQLELEAKITAQENATKENGYKLDEAKRIAEEQKKTWDARHLENASALKEVCKKQEQHSRMLWVGMGLLLALQFAGPYLVSAIFHVAKP